MYSAKTNLGVQHFESGDDNTLDFSGSATLLASSMRLKLAVGAAHITRDAVPNHRRNGPPNSEMNFVKCSLVMSYGLRRTLVRNVSPRVLY